MARQSQIIQPSQEDLLRALTAGQGGVDTSAAVKGVIQGEDLASTILKNKQAQEDRVKTLQEKINAIKREREYKKAAGAANPDIANEIGFIPKESAESILKSKLASQSDEAKLARAQLHGQSPDKIKQLFQVGDKVMGVTYGGNVQPINVPGDQTLNPLNKTLPAEQVEKTGTFAAMKDLIGRIRADITDPKTGTLSEKGKSYLGPLDALSQTVKAFTPAADPVAANFHQKLQDLKNQIIYLRSGKQINEEEYKRLRASLPSEYRDDSIFLDNLANFEKTFQDVAAKRQEAFQQAGYKTPGNDTPPPAAGNPGVTSPQKGGFRVIAVRPSKGG